MKWEWKPGDVGLSTCGERFVVNHRGDCFWPGDGERPSWSGLSGNPTETDRPLVVIDPESREQVERLVKVVHGGSAWWNDVNVPTHTSLLMIALREFANPRDPKPDEPTGLGAVVEDATGMRWVRVKSVTTVRHWRHEHGGDRKRYDDIAVVRVLSEGVTNDA